jgi:hypothetical protein
MTDKERKIINKLKAIIKDTPYAGEKATAINVLKNYCLKHNIDESELQESEKKRFEYIVHGRQSDLVWDENIALFEVICQKFYERRNENFWEQGHRGYQDEHAFHYYLLMTSEDFINLIAEYEFYKKAFKKAYKKAFSDWEKDFFRAFLKKQNLLLNPDDDDYFEAPTQEQLAREKRSALIAEDIDEAKYHKQLEKKGE